MLSVFNYEEAFTINALLNERSCMNQEMEIDSDTKDCLIIAIVDPKMKSYLPVCKKCQYENKIQEEKKLNTCGMEEAAIIPEITIDEKGDTHVGFFNILSGKKLTEEEIGEFIHKSGLMQEDIQVPSSTVDKDCENIKCDDDDNDDDVLRNV